MATENDLLQRLTRRQVLTLGAAGAAGLGLSLLSGDNGRAAAGPARRTLVVAIDSDPAVLNPAIVTAPSALTASGQVFNTLLRLDRQGRLHGELAASWKVGPDARHYALHLRKGIKWHDGRPFTPADVAFSLLQVSKKYSGQGAQAYGPVEAIETPDDYTAVIRLNQPFPGFFPWALCDWTYSQIVPKHIYEGTDPTQNPANFRPVGTGAFKFVEWQKGDHITFTRNAEYWKPDLPFLTRVVFQVIPSLESRVAALLKGEVDYIPYYALPASAYSELSKAAGITVDNSPRPPAGLIILFYNVRKPPLDSVPVRQAIAYAIDRKALIAKAMNGLAKFATSLTSSADKTYHVDPKTQYDFNPRKANALLDQAGTARGGGSRLSIRLSYDRTGVGGALEDAAQLMREQLKAVGIELQLVPLDNATWGQAAMVKWDFDLTMGTFSTGPDPAIGLDRLFLTSEIKPVYAHNFTGYSNPELDALFKQAKGETNPAKRKTEYATAQEVLARDVPALPLWENVYLCAFNKTLSGLPQGPFQFEPLEAVK